MSTTTRPPGPMVVVCSAKGGAGTTTLATNLALTAQLDGSGTILVDGDPRFGDLGIRLQLPPPPPAAAGPLRLRHRMLTHGTGLRVVLPSPQAELPDLDRAELIEALSALQTDSELVVVDAPPRITQTADVIALADGVLVATLGDLASVKNAKLVVDTLRAHDAASSAVHLVVNRANGHTDAAEIGAAVGAEVAAVIPDDPWVPSAEPTEPLVLADRKHPVAKAFRHLFDKVVRPAPA